MVLFSTEVQKRYMICIVYMHNLAMKTSQLMVCVFKVFIVNKIGLGFKKIYKSIAYWSNSCEVLHKPSNFVRSRNEWLGVGGSSLKFGICVGVNMSEGMQEYVYGYDSIQRTALKQPIWWITIGIIIRLEEMPCLWIIDIT